MNEDLERSLREVPVASVPDRLDEKVETLIRRFEAGGPRRSDRRVPLWAAALACAACVGLGFVAYPVLRSPEPMRSPEPSVIYIENLRGDCTSGRPPPDLISRSDGTEDGRERLCPVD